MIKKIHLVGADFDNKFGMEFFVKKSFDQLNWETICTSYRKLNKELVEMRIRNITGVDFLLCIKGERVSPESIYLAKVPTVLWQQDSIQANQDALNVIQARAWAYKKVYTFDPVEIPLYKQYGVKAEWLPLAADTDTHKPDTQSSKSINIGFVGSMTPSREALISCILTKYPVQYNYTHSDYVKIVNKTVINLNVGIINSGIQMRVFEILACGGFLLTNEIAEEGKLFKNVEHLIYYTDKNLFELLDYYLLNDRARIKIGMRGREEVLAKHTYKHRVETIIKNMERL